ncbi:hypothetical protein NC99_12410 [Sunxiuqinia dokdonensis]|uniref:Uncharacterized protein n=1 Tax=Sunxiuqinia dokdonensis TaxID=1409788 RepID=A0A0L8VCJ5_9BACT|nr:hypothetical protein NC99_12410 [Sunxiuqinia dokdonensis]
MYALPLQNTFYNFLKRDFYLFMIFFYYFCRSKLKSEELRFKVL